MLPSLDVVAVSQAPFPQIFEDIYVFLQIFEELLFKSSKMCFFKSSKPIATSSLQSSIFKEAYICASIGNTSQDYNSRPGAPLSILSLSLFIRNY